MSRTLYECSHARVQDTTIYCKKGHPLSPRSGDGTIDSKRLTQGEPLVLNICQQCRDFDRIGEALPRRERGWLRMSR